MFIGQPLRVLRRQGSLRDRWAAWGLSSGLGRGQHELDPGQRQPDHKVLSKGLAGHWARLWDSVKNR